MELSFGVCRLAMVSVCKEANHLSLQVTQLLFGDHYEVLAESEGKEWLLIRIYFDQTQGWIESNLHHAITQEYFDQINTADFKITTDVCSTILYKKTPISILLGSIVPISQSELFKMEEQFAFNGESKALGQKREFEFIKAIALKYLNAPEQRGGKTPFGVDGSGLVQMVYKICGYHLSRSAESVLNQGKKIKDFQSHRPGDLAFFKSYKEKTLKVGLILGDDKIIHVDGRARVDQLLEDGILDLETKIRTHQLEAIVAVMPL